MRAALAAAEVPQPAVRGDRRRRASRPRVPGGPQAGRAVGQPGRDPGRRPRRGAAAAASASVRSCDGPLLVEQYVPGVEVAVEGLLRDGALTVLAVFDKPDPLDGPVLRGDDLRHAVAAADAATLGARRDRDRARLRGDRSHRRTGARRAALDGDRVRVIEVAARSIGGLCARTLRFGAGIALEELVLRHALGMPLDGLDARARRVGRDDAADPAAGTSCARCDGQDEAPRRARRHRSRDHGPTRAQRRAAPRRRPLPRLPVRARPTRPHAVERALRDARAALDVDIEADSSRSADAPLHRS